MRILVIADTHLTDARSTQIVDVLGSRLDDADAILHAGDITAMDVIDRLGQHAPVLAVAGNNDDLAALPDTVEDVVGGVRIAIVHDSGPAAGRTERLAAAFPDADVVVFGHSHLPWHETTRIGERVQHHFNPGSPTQRRRAPHRTVGWIAASEDGTISCRHEILDAPE